MSFRPRTPHHSMLGASLVSETKEKLLEIFLEVKAKIGITQAELARRLGVDRSVINRQLHNEADLSLMRVGEIAAILGRRVQIVFAEEDAVTTGFRNEAPDALVNWSNDNFVTQKGTTGASGSSATIKSIQSA